MDSRAATLASIVLLPLNHSVQDVCGVGLRDPLADFVLELVLLLPVFDPLLADSALTGVALVENAVETEGRDHGAQGPHTGSLGAAG